MLHRTILVLVAALSVFGCASKKKSSDGEFVLLGRTDASSDPEPGVFDPIDDGNLDALRERGRLLHDMERALALAYERGAFEVGVGEGNVVLPLVDVDPGGRSAQVVFLRWTPDTIKGGNVYARDASRWLMVSLLLSPDRVLDVELLGGTVPEDSVELRRAEDIIEAAHVLRDKAPESAFHLFSVTERLPSRNAAGSFRQTRVYALSADGEGPDLEIVVARKPKKKRAAPTVLDAMTVHAEGGALADPIAVSALHPRPATVARALMRGSSAVDVDARTPQGLFRISTRTGRVERVGADPGPAAHGSPTEAPAPSDPTASPTEPPPSGS
jgi:hypothetical protein